MNISYKHYYTCKNFHNGELFRTNILFNPNRYRPQNLSFVISIVSGCYFSFQQVLVKYLNSLSVIYIEALSWYKFITSLKLFGLTI